MKPEPMNIAVSVSKYYLPYTYVMLHSLLKNNACPINVYILHRNCTLPILIFCAH